MPRDLTARLAVPAISIGLLAVVVALYGLNQALYVRLLTVLMQRPGPQPFMDWAWIPSVVECWNLGVNVYVDNTCYTMVPHGRHSYSPLWLRATFLPLGSVWVSPVGIALAVAFLLSLATLPPPRNRRDFMLTLLATLSSLTVFALERANVDVIIFLLALLGVHLWAGGLASRLCGYAVFTFAALLKFYPLVLLILALRERVRVFVPVCLAVVGALAAFVWTYRVELAAIGGNIPRGSYFMDLFGAVNFPFGLGSLGVRAAGWFGPLDEAAATLVSSHAPRALLAALTAGALAGAAWLAGRRGVRTGLAGLPARESGALVAGAALLCGCFFTGQSLGYRGVFLLLVLPGLLSLSRTLPDRSGRGLMLGTCAAIVFVMWVLVIQTCIVAIGAGVGIDAATSVARLVHWLVHEAAWWSIIAVLLSVLLSFVLNSPLWGAVRAAAPWPGPARRGRAAR